MFAKNKETVYSDIFIARSCSKAETLLRRTNALDFVCFLYASLSRISKVETAKRSLLQTDNFFSPKIKKETCLWTQRKILGIPRNEESIWTFLLHFAKKLFLYFATTMILFDVILQFWKSTILLSRTLYLSFIRCPVQTANSCFASLKAISGRDR